MIDQSHGFLTENAQTFLKVFFDFWPIAAVGGLTGMIRGMRKIASERTLMDKICTLIFAALSGAGAAFVGVLCLPLIMGHYPSVEIQVGLAGLLGGVGNQLFAILMRKIFKLSIIGVK